MIYHLRAISNSFNKTHDKQSIDQTNYCTSQIKFTRRQVLTLKFDTIIPSNINFNSKIETLY